MTNCLENISLDDRSSNINHFNPTGNDPGKEASCARQSERKEMSANVSRDSHSTSPDEHSRSFNGGKAQEVS